MSHSRDQSQKQDRKSSISKSLHEDEITNNAYFFRSLLEEGKRQKRVLGVGCWVLGESRFFPKT
jgi:hypothetical protein